MSLRWPSNQNAKIVDHSNLLQGIEFAMYDGETQVMCRVTAQALDDLAAEAGAGENWQQTFERFRDKIGQVASDLYDKGDKCPVVINSEI